MRVASLQGPLEIGVDYRRYVQASKTDQVAPPFFNPAKPNNIGDWFLTKIVDRILDYDDLILIQRGADHRDWDLVNEECDVLVLRGGNYIQNRWFSTFVGLERLRRIKIPIVLFGAGLQMPPGGRPFFEPEEKDALDYIHDSCAFSAVRGHSTAEALASIGINNVIVTGCPTLFWARRPTLHLRPARYDRTGFSFRKTLYSAHGPLNRAEFAAMDALRQRSGEVTVFLQGEEVALQRYLQATQWGAEFEGRMEPLAGHHLQRLRRDPLDSERLFDEVHRLFDPHAEREMVDWLIQNAFFSWDVEEMIRSYRSVDLMLGCRLHGNLLALANGTPAYYLTYDERTREVVELIGAPNCPLEDFGPGIDLCGQNWRPTQMSYVHLYRQMLRFLDANRLEHRLPYLEEGAPPDADGGHEELEAVPAVGGSPGSR